MAQKVLIQLVSDLSGADIDDGDGQTVKFGWLGVDYSIDLTNKEVDKFAKVLEPYLAVATKTGGRKTRGASAGPKKDTKAIREWANANGYEVGDRGRIPADVVEAYEAAN